MVVHYHSSAKAAEELVDLLRHKGTRAWAFGADLSEPSQTEDLLTQAMTAAGRIDILVNSASVFEPDNVWDCAEEMLWYNIRLHAWAPLVLARQLALQEGSAQIVNVLDARLGGYDPKHVSYQLSKQMLFSLTRILAVELAPRIRVNGVAPGLILPPQGQDESYLQKLAHTNPLQRHGDAQDVVDAVLYLLHATFVTGEVIYVDGGRHLGRSTHG